MTREPEGALSVGERHRSLPRVATSEAHLVFVLLTKARTINCTYLTTDVLGRDWKTDSRTALFRKIAGFHDSVFQELITICKTTGISPRRAA